MDADADGGVSWAVYHHKNTDAPETDFLTLDEDGREQVNDSVLDIKVIG